MFLNGELTIDEETVNSHYLPLGQIRSLMIPTGPNKQAGYKTNTNSFFRALPIPTSGYTKHNLGPKRTS